MFEEPADDADDANVFAQVRNPRAQATDAAHDQVDLHAGAGGFVEFLDDLLVDERIELHDHAAGFSGRGMVAFAFDHSDEAVLQVEGRHQQFFQAGITGQTGEGVEDDGDFLGDFRIGREAG